jgi:LysM repeat protein
VKFIIARKGDTYFRISKEFDVALWQLYKYNDFGSKKDFLEEGDLVYLQPKRNRSRTKAVLVLKEATTLISISQKEAINIESLLKMNKDILSENQNISSGKKVILR